MKTRRELWEELRDDLRRRGDLEPASTREVLIVAAWLAWMAVAGFLVARAVLG